MVSDDNKGISLITYGQDNMPLQVTTAAGNLQYVYDAMGRKRKKTLNQSGTATVTEYASSKIYEKVGTAANVLKYMDQPEGYVSVNAGAYTYTYQHTDHLGNARVNYRNASTVQTTATPQITEENNYYPFGMEHKGYNTGIVQEYLFKNFQGQEVIKDLSLNIHEWKYRTSDPSIGRFWQIDLLSEDFCYNSTYAFSENSPIAFAELEGLEKVLAIYFHSGPTGGGKPTTVSASGYTGDYFEATRNAAESAGRDFRGTIIVPGVTSSSGVQTGLRFAIQNYDAGDQVIVYGYSYGVDVAVDLAEEFKSQGVSIDLLVTVDGSDGPLQNSTVNTDIPDNVKNNLNVYQTDDSRTSRSSRSSGVTSYGTSSGSSNRSNSGSSDSPGSNGGTITAKDSSKTNVTNTKVTAKGTTHGNIQEKVKTIVLPAINASISNYPKIN